MKLYDIQEPQESGDDSIEATSGSPILGIDFGTTNSLIAISKNSEVEIINIDGSPKVPSVVIHNDEEFLIGKAALNNTLKNTNSHGLSNALHSIKRFIALHKEFVELKTVSGRKKLVSPIEISSYILKYLKDKASEHLGYQVERAVITVPAYFDENARAAVKTAAKLAGLEIRRMINEPTAAAIAYNLDKGVKGSILVFDMGGGTFDISILKMNMGVFQVIATGGDNHLGGDDYDNVIAKILEEKASPSNSLLYNDEQNIREIKEKLCRVYNARQQGKAMKVGGVSFEEFHNRSSHLTKKSINITKRTIRASEIELDDIEHVILVGGATRLPFLKDAVIKEFPNQKIHYSIDPDLAVVIGAAYQAENLSGALKDKGNMNLLIDVIPLSLGIELADGNVEKIIYRNTPLPIEFKKMFTTSVDGQTGIKIHVVQGEAEGASDCKSITRFELTDIPSMKAGEVRLEIKFNVDVDGLLWVSATELVSGIHQELEINPSYGLSQEEALKLIVNI